MKKIAICPGSFDPITNGHLDIIERGSKLFDEIRVVLLNNQQKQPFFTIQERLQLIQEVTKHIKNIQVDVHSGLLVEYAEKVQACAVIRGLRAVSDFEYEMQITAVNKKLKDELETVFIMANTAYSFISSSIVKEVASYGGDLSGLIPNVVQTAFEKKFK
ncbi:MAG TPA: pantetheine-phosphate adenylyltransferase [Firmicutes bacterium]|nr:pantetheine-phosphate adenylyltransferase [Bacillales bacterium]HJA40441.1 pantetheine-phosphate adenylyltransferase [Bacillota bacterium]